MYTWNEDFLFLAATTKCFTLISKKVQNFLKLSEDLMVSLFNYSILELTHQRYL